MSSIAIYIEMLHTTGCSGAEAGGRGGTAKTDRHIILTGEQMNTSIELKTVTIAVEGSDGSFIIHVFCLASRTDIHIFHMRLQESLAALHRTYLTLLNKPTTCRHTPVILS